VRSHGALFRSLFSLRRAGGRERWCPQVHHCSVLSSILVGRERELLWGKMLRFRSAHSSVDASLANRFYGEFYVIRTFSGPFPIFKRNGPRSFRASIHSGQTWYRLPEGLLQKMHVGISPAILTEKMATGTETLDLRPSRTRHLPSSHVRQGPWWVREADPS
jgi:hypothetical protein